jgi:hypothetical protein
MPKLGPDTTDHYSYYIMRAKKTNGYDDSIQFRKRQPNFANISITSVSKISYTFFSNDDSSSRFCSCAQRRS